MNKIQQYSLCPALRTGCGCSVLISGSPRTASTTCYFYLTYTRRTAQTGHLHGLLSLFPGLRCLLLLQLLCHLGLPLNLTEALAAHFLGSKTFFCTQLRKKGKKKNTYKKDFFPLSCSQYKKTSSSGFRSPCLVKTYSPRTACSRRWKKTMRVDPLVPSVKRLATYTPVIIQTLFVFVH